MKKIKVICLSLLMLFACSNLSAQTEDNERKKRRGMQGRDRGNVMQLIKRLDRNNDKTLTADEIPERLLERFARFDVDENGVIDTQEIRKIAEQVRGMRGERDGKMRGKRRRGDGDRKGKRRGEMNDQKGEGASEEGKRRRKRGDKEGEAPREDGKRKRGRANGPDLEGLMNRFDKNGDQMISMDEAPERLQKAFARIDANGDELLDQSELKSLAQMMQHRDGDGKKKRKRRDNTDEAPKGGVKPKRPGG